MRWAPILYASRRSTPIAICRSAYSVVTMTPSTSMPATSIRENRTTIFIVIPNAFNAVIPTKNEPGIANPTRVALRRPKFAKTTTITIITAAPTLLPRSLNIRLTSLESSKR